MPLRLAVVDDESAVRTSLHRLLSIAGFEVDTFECAESFLGSSLETFHCVLLDLHLPGMDGIAVARQLSHAAPHVPVVMLTGHDAPDLRERARDIGVKAVLKKPAEAKVLLETIHSLTRQRG